MDGHLVYTDFSAGPVTTESVKAALDAKTLLWLDLDGVDDTVIDLLRDVFRIHALALEDVREWGQRPKAEDYDTFVSIVMYGAREGRADDDDADLMAQVQLFYSDTFLVSVRRDRIPAMQTAHHSLGHGAHATGMGEHLLVLWRVLDALADSISPMLSDVDDEIDTLQDRIFTNPARQDLAALFGLKRKIVEARKVVAPERDMMSAILTGLVPIPGMTAEKERYFRDVYDHLVRASELTDSYRDLLSGSMDAYTSMESNKLNVVMKQLAIISTIFLPLSFLTGFFGQNFAWMVNRITGWETFFGVGLGTEAVAVILLLMLFRRRGWL